MQNGIASLKNSFMFSYEIRQLTYDLAILLLDIYQDEWHYMSTGRLIFEC